MGHLDIGKLRAAKLEMEPFEFVVVPAFLVAESVRQVNATFPSITKGGSYPIESLRAGMVIREVIEELDSAEFQAAVAEKFGMDLTDKPKMYSLRGYLRTKDGSIHTDSKDKIITVLLYLNELWPHRAGRLRLLRGRTSRTTLLKYRPTMALCSSSGARTIPGMATIPMRVIGEPCR